MKRSADRRCLALAGLAFFATAGMGGAGRPDQAFNANGRITTDLTGAGAEDTARSILLQPDGQIIVAGSWDGRDDSNFAMARYTPSGQLDRNFGIGGLVTQRIPGLDGEIAALALQPDGRIVAAGFNRIQGGTNVAVVRYGADGQLDRGFGQGGLVTTSLDALATEAAAIAIQRDGKIVAAGCAGCMTGHSRSLVVRYLADGALDSGFGDHGKLVIEFPDQSGAIAALAVLPDGDIIAAGFAAAQRSGFGPDTDFSLLRLQPDGRLDPEFGDGGQAMTDFGQRENDAATAIVSMPDGGILAGGSAYVGSKRFALCRYRSDGSLDRTFGRNGLVTTDFGRGSGYAQGASGTGLALQSDGRIVLVGVLGQGTDFALARYLDNGLPDVTFGDDGTMMTDFHGGNDAASGVVITPSGRIIVGGTATNQGDADFGVASYTSSVLE